MEKFRVTACAASLAGIYLAGCSGGARQPLAPAAILDPAASGGAAASSDSVDRARLFVPSYAGNLINIYPTNVQHPTPIATITNGVVAPAALAVDPSGRLYVANNWGNSQYSDEVTEFARGATSPDKALTGLYRPYAVAVDSARSVYVADNGLIQVYENGSTTPSRHLASPNLNAMTFDRHDNLYALTATLRGSREIWFTRAEVFLHGTAGPKDLGISIRGNGYGIALDGRGNMYVGYFGDNNQSAVNVYHPGARMPFRSITSGVAAPTQMAFARTGVMYVPNDNASNVTVYAPGGQTPIDTISSGEYGIFAVAVDPPAP